MDKKNECQICGKPINLEEFDETREIPQLMARKQVCFKCAFWFNRLAYDKELLSDILGTEEDTIYKDLENEAERKLLIRALNKLNSREKLIVSMRFGLDNPDGKEKTQKEVADLLGISQSYISRLEKKIMQRLKREMVRYE